jgi:molybdate transport system substrate-binding protein
MAALPASAARAPASARCAIRPPGSIRATATESRTSPSPARRVIRTAVASYRSEVCRARLNTRPRRFLVVASSLAVVGLVAGVHAQPVSGADGAPTGSGTVTAFAAASLTSAFQAVAAAFEKTHPDAKVQLNLAGSSTLAQQIEQGAPADVFASADETNMQQLVKTGAIAGTTQIFARNRLQIVVAPGNPKGITGLADLTKPGLTIALCGPTVPCGRYAAEAFHKAGVTAPASSQELDVKAVLNKVAMGEADAGIVYVTDVRAAGSKVAGVDIPESSNVVARYPIAVVKDAPNLAAAITFMDYVLSPDGQQVLARFGFLPP